MSAGDLVGATLGRATITVRRGLRTLRGEAGFTLIELVLAATMLMIIAAPITAILSAGAVTAKSSRERTGADQLALAEIESIRSVPYLQIGTVHGNPDGLFLATNNTSLPGGEQVVVSRSIVFVNSPVLHNPYPTAADYKKIVVTVSRQSDGHVLAQDVTYVASAAAPPNNGTTWVQIKRQLVDAVTNGVLQGVNLNLTGGPDNVNRNDTTDASGNVVFPALTSSTTSTPVFTLVSTFSGYSVFPDDISPGAPSSIPSTPGLVSTGTIRMYKPTTLTVNVQTSSGAAYTSGATISVDSSRCGLASVSIPSGQSQAVITTCNPWGSTSVPLPPNVSGQVPADSNYYVTAWSNSGGYWSTGTSTVVPASYPSNLSQTVNVKFVSSTFSTTKQIKVTVTKGGSNDTNARVEVTGSPTGISPGIDLFATTNGSGQATFTVPVVSSSTTFSIYANDMGVAKQSSSPVPTVSLNTSSTSPTTITVPIS